MKLCLGYDGSPMSYFPNGDISMLTVPAKRPVPLPAPEPANARKPEPDLLRAARAAVTEAAQEYDTAIRAVEPAATKLRTAQIALAALLGAK